jgi:Rad3-related DNA helicase
MKDRLKEADLCILPYNYVLDSDLREQINLDLENSVIIFDEGHNIESHCEELF